MSNTTKDNNFKQLRTLDKIRNSMLNHYGSSSPEFAKAEADFLSMWEKYGKKPKVYNNGRRGTTRKSSAVSSKKIKHVEKVQQKRLDIRVEFDNM